MSGSEGSSGHSAGDSAAAEKKAKSKVSRTSMILWHSHQNDSAAVRKLLEEDQSLVHAIDYDNRTPLHVASLHGWTDVAKCLIEYGADVNAQDRWKNTPLADAEGAKKQAMIELLKSYGGLSYVSSMLSIALILFIVKFECLLVHFILFWLCACIVLECSSFIHFFPFTILCKLGVVGGCFTSCEC
ncbi:hypothetical protein CsSME_00043569 [Camellia sinensis var. sinensis]